MSNIYRVRAVLELPSGGPGVSTFYCLTPTSFVPELRTFYQNFTTALPAGVHIQVQGQGDVIDDASGALTGSWATANVAPVDGQVAGVYSAASGLCVNWLTGTVLDGGRLRGRTFIVPAASSAYDSTGTLENTLLNGLRAGANDFVAQTAGNFVIWHRNRPATLSGGVRIGGHGAVTGSLIKDKVAVLRSRRD